MYKVFLFIKIAKALKAGSLNLQHSYKYRSFDEYLIPKEKWDNEKGNYINKSDLKKYLDSNKVLADLKLILDNCFNKTNKNILSGSNEYVRFDKNNKLRLVTPKLEKEVNNSALELFITGRYISLSEVLATINDHTKFIDVLNTGK